MITSRCVRTLSLYDTVAKRVTVQCRRGTGHDGRHTGNTGTLKLTWYNTEPDDA